MNSNERLINIITKYRDALQRKIKERKAEMESDNNEHYMIYNALGITDSEGYQIDLQQNVGRFLYKYAGSLLEELTIACFQSAFPDAKAKVKLANTIDKSPQNIEIDCLVGNKAYEIRWKDATTDGDHVKKEHKRVLVIKDAGYIPVRIMFFEPNREQALRIQSSLKKLYESVGGEYYSGEAAWEYVKEETGIDMKALFMKIKHRRPM